MDKTAFEKFGHAALVAAAVALGFLLRAPREAPMPSPLRPAVPSVVPPECDGPCMGCRPQSPRPFSVACPHCRNRLIATPPHAGEVGEVAKAEAEAAGE